jgi:hypothetical protein
MLSALLLRLVPFKGLVLAALAAAALATIGAEYVVIQHKDAEYLALGAAFGKAKLAASQAALQADEAQRAIETARVTAQAEVQDEYDSKVAAAQADAASAVAASGSLQHRYAAALAALRRAGSHPAAPGVSPAVPGADPADLLADMQHRLDAAAGQLADVAVARGLRAAECEADYDALKK